MNNFVGIVVDFFLQKFWLRENNILLFFNFFTSNFRKLPYLKWRLWKNMWIIFNRNFFKRIIRWFSKWGCLITIKLFIWIFRNWFNKLADVFQTSHFFIFKFNVFKSLRPFSIILLLLTNLIRFFFSLDII